MAPAHYTPQSRIMGWRALISARRARVQGELFKPDPGRKYYIDHKLGSDMLREYPNFLPGPGADQLLDVLIREIPWETATISIAGKTLPIPRLQCWMGDEGANYAYSGMQLQARPWHPEVHACLEVITNLTGLTFNSVLLNYYRDGRDSVSWHADDEKELGDQPVIAAISLGAQRPFQLRGRYGGGTDRYSIHPVHGSLLVMSKFLQANWLHSVPKVPDCGPRVSLTFRQILWNG